MTSVQGGLPPPPPPPASRAGLSSAPSSDQKRRRAEEERRRAQAAWPSAAEPRNRSADTSGRPPPTNWLKRETPFVCDVRFTNDLSEVPCDPKMLVAPLDPQQLAKFHLTTLERDPKRDLVLEPDLGIPLTVFDIGRYAVPANPPPLAPEDQALLEGDEGDEALDASSPAMRPRQRLRGNKAELSWLMRTTYISNDPGGQAAKGIPEKQAKVIRDAMAQQRQPEDAQAHQIQQIEATFEAAQQPPVHPKNPSLQAVEVLPVLPDEELWPNEYVQLVFDSDPTADVPHLRGKSAAERRQFAEAGVAKPYKMSVPGETETNNFLALLLPTQLPDSRESDAGPREEEQKLQWVREYKHTMTQDDQDFVFLFGGGGRVGYVDMNYRLAAQRFKKGSTPLSQLFSKPIRTSIKRRAPDEAEQETHAQRLRRLNTGVELDEEDEEPPPEEQRQGSGGAEQQGGAAGSGGSGGGGGQSDQASSPVAEAQPGGAAQQADAGDYSED